MAQQPAVTLVVGDETVLVDRAVGEVIATARSAAGAEEVDVVEVDPASLTDLDVSVVFSPSLFGDRRVVVIRAAQDLPAAGADRIVAALGDLAAEITVVVVHAGGQKGKALLGQLRERADVVVECPKVTRYRERADFVRAEVARHGATIDGPATDALLEGVGSDLAELSIACAQLAADSDGRIDVDVVTCYHRSPAEVTGFAVADAAVDGDVGSALAQLRWALDSGVAPVLVTSALASGVRQIAQVAAAGRSARPAEIARDLKLPPWKVERVQRQARGWHPDGIAVALDAVATADADVKGAGVDPAYALERAVLTITAARRG